MKIYEKGKGSMLILLFLTVLVISKVLWWLKDKFRRMREGFSGIPVNARVPSADEALGAALGAITPALQTEARSTPIMEVPTIDAIYQRDQAAAAAAAAQTERGVAQEVQTLLGNSSPGAPLAQTLAIQQGGPGMAAAVAAAEATRIEEERLEDILGAMERQGMDKCFQKDCMTLQTAGDQACREFGDHCMFKLGMDVSRCLKSMDDRCSTGAVEACRAACQKKFQEPKNILMEGEVLEANHRLSNLSGSTQLLLRDDGRLELYVRGQKVFGTRPTVGVGGGAGTLDQGPYTLHISASGNLSVRNGIQMDIWSSNTWLSALNAGEVNGPFQLVVSEGRAVLLNRHGAQLWTTENAL